MSDTFDMAAYNHYQGRLLLLMDRNFINAAQTHNYVPRLTKEQVEAIAEEDGMYLNLEWEPGALAFVHYHQIFHSRTAYEDFDEPERQRQVTLFV